MSRSGTWIGEEKTALDLRYKILNDLTLDVLDQAIIVPASVTS